MYFVGLLVRLAFRCGCQASNSSSFRSLRVSNEKGGLSSNNSKALATELLSGISEWLCLAEVDGMVVRVPQLVELAAVAV